MALEPQPVLHNITPDRVIFCYRDNDAASRRVAEYYQVARELDNDHLIPLPCVSDNIITEDQYEIQIEIPLLNALAGLTGADMTGAGVISGYELPIWVIILGYNIPHIYTVGSDGEKIAIASRLHRLRQPKQYKLPNFTYDRRGNWKYFDSVDAEDVYITAIIDGPTEAAAKKLIDRSIDVDNQIFMTGKVYLDPYGKKLTSSQLEYQDDILDFITNSVSNLGLDTQITVDVQDPYGEPLTARFEHDSFYWGWYTPRYSRNLFLNQNERRAFLYNADDDAAADISATFDVNGSDPWCTLAINIEPGYASCAGAVDAPDENAYLRPRPFFESLHRGATLGESFLYASPFLSWKIVLIGDPMLVVNFPDEIPPDEDVSNDNTQVIITDDVPNHEVIRQSKELIEESLGYALRQSRLTQELVDRNYLSQSIIEEYYMLEDLVKWRDAKSPETRYNLHVPVVASLLEYILTTTQLTLPQWLAVRNEKISEFFNNTLNTMASDVVPSSYIYPQGEWQYEFVYFHDIHTLEYVHFTLQVSADESIGSDILEISSLDERVGWYYANELYDFTPFTELGFPSNFAGRRVRYISPAKYRLTRTEIYYVRWRAFSESGQALTDWSTSERMIIKR